MCRRTRERPDKNVKMLGFLNPAKTGSVALKGKRQSVMK